MKWEKVVCWSVCSETTTYCWNALLWVADRVFSVVFFFCFFGLEWTECFFHIYSD